MHVSGIILSAGIVALAAGFAQAGAIIELIPDDPGPYYGGESVTVDVWVNGNTSVDLGLRGIQFDFSDSDPTLSFASTFAFDLSSIPSDINGYVTFPDLPVPRTFMTLDCLCPELLVQLPVQQSLHIGSVALVLPTELGAYRMDILNSGEGDASLGAWMRLGFTTGPEGLWRAYTGDITGGTLDFVVIPEPGTLTLLVLGLLAVIRPRHRHIRVVGNGSLGQGGPSLQRWGT